MSNFIVAPSIDEYAWSKHTRDGVSGSTTCSDETCGANRACLATSCNLGDASERRISTEADVYRDQFVASARSRFGNGRHCLDAGVDTVEGAAAETPALEPEPEQQREIPTPVLPIETTTKKKQVPREKKADQKKAGKKPSKRQRMSSGEKDATASMAAPGLTEPESTRGSGIVVVETKSPPYTTSRRNTPIRQSAQAARLLLSTSRSKQKEEETFSEEETRKEEEKKEADSSTTVSSLSESDEGLNTQLLLKKEKLKKKKPHHHKGNISASASATSVASASKSKLSTSVTSETSASKLKSKRSTAVHPKTTEQKKEQSVVISDKDQEASRAEPEETADEIPETIAVPGRKRDKRPGPFKTSNLQRRVKVIWTDLQQRARDFLTPATPKIIDRFNDVYTHLCKISHQQTQLFLAEVQWK